MIVHEGGEGDPVVAETCDQRTTTLSLPIPKDKHVYMCTLHITHLIYILCNMYSYTVYKDTDVSINTYIRVT